MLMQCNIIYSVLGNLSTRPIKTNYIPIKLITSTTTFLTVLWQNKTPSHQTPKLARETRAAVSKPEAKPQRQPVHQPHFPITLQDKISILRSKIKTTFSDQDNRNICRQSNHAMTAALSILGSQLPRRI